jgi:hypothetical protein
LPDPDALAFGLAKMPQSGNHLDFGADPKIRTCNRYNPQQ